MIFLIFICFVGLSLTDEQREFIEGPNSKQETDAWLQDQLKWRQETLSRVKYDDHVYRMPELKWTESSFVQPQMMIQDRYFFDIDKYEYTVDRYLDELEERYGGIDSVLVWPFYPNSGIDNRNSYDFIESMPGGLEGVKGFVEDFHARGVKVLFPYFPWDTGTRPNEVPDEKALPDLLKKVGADGFNGDTCGWGDVKFWEHSLDINYPIVIEPEGGGSLETLWFTKFGWGYWYNPKVPLVDAYKWLESRHMTHICDRWAMDKTYLIQFSFFNGIGVESWENVWGINMGFTDRNSEQLRRSATILRFFSDFTASPTWIPHVMTIQEDVYASMFPGTGVFDNQTLWTFVNRDDKEDKRGTQIEIDYDSTYAYYNVYAGEEVHPKPTGNGKSASVEFWIERMGIVGLFALPKSAVTPRLKTFLSEMKDMTVKKLQEFSNEFKFLQQEMVKIERTKVHETAPEDMVRINATKFHFVSQGVEVEPLPPLPGNNGVDFQYPPEDQPNRLHDFHVDLSSYYIDKFPVTNEKFKQFYDKRLPNEYEWQYAGQGPEYKIYPWGNYWDWWFVPWPDMLRDPRPPENVDLFPQSVSDFGVWDLIGNKWEFTNEFRDERTRAVSLKGGSLCYPQDAMWYFQHANFKLTDHGKWLLMADSYDRSRYVGFRCAADAE